MSCSIKASLSLRRTSSSVKAQISVHQDESRSADSAQMLAFLPPRLGVVAVVELVAAGALRLSAMRI